MGKTACELSLGRNINLTNCVDLLILADTHSAAQLQRSCLQFTVDNLAKIMSSLTGKSKLSAHPAIMAQILQATAEQKEKEDPRAKRRKKELTSFASLFSSRSSTESDE